MNRLASLHELGGQSPWLDYLRRDHLEDGTIDELVARGVRGLTSNPAIFEAALNGTNAYDRDIDAAAYGGVPAESVFWDVACADVSAAADIFSDLHRMSDGSDGFVSIEVDPRLAHDATGTVDQATALWSRLSRPNVMIKVPATPSGVIATEELIAQGINVNVTLIFGLRRYSEVMDAHVRGVRRLADSSPLGTPIRVASVASFFVSRVDSRLDPLLPVELQGRAAVAQASLAWKLSTERYSHADWLDVSARGARPQRPLWASTSTKNPSYPDTKYVDALVAPGTVNTIPLQTLRAFEDHGSPLPSLEQGLERAAVEWARICELVDTDALAHRLEKEGVEAFSSSIDSAVSTIASRLESTT